MYFHTYVRMYECTHTRARAHIYMYAYMHGMIYMYKRKECLYTNAFLNATGNMRPSVCPSVCYLLNSNQILSDFISQVECAKAHHSPPPPNHHADVLRRGQKPPFVRVSEGVRVKPGVKHCTTEPPRF